MTRKTGKTGTTKFSYTDGHKLLTLLDVTQLKTLLEHTFPENRTTQIGASVVKTNCLAGSVTGHIDKNPSMYIDVARGTIKCKSCGYFSRNLLQLFQDARGWSYRETLSHVLTYTGRRLVSEKTESDVEAYDIHNLAVTTLLYVCATYAQRLLAPPVDPEDRKNYDEIALHAAAPVLEWLFQHRKHKPEYIGILPYGIWPPQHLLYSYAVERLEAQASAQYARFQNTHLTPERREKILARIKTIAEPASSEWTNTVAFFNGHGLRTPGRIRLRRSHNEDEKDGNYLTLPGFTEDEPIGYFGLFAPHLGGLDPAEAKALRFYLVEGENDAITAQEHFIASGLTGFVFLASNGAHNDLDALVAAGIDTIYIIPDHPSRGKGEVWLRGRLLTGSEIGINIFRGWSELDKVPGMPKDPDDVIQLGGFEIFKRTVIDEAAKWFVPVDVWAFDRAIEDAATLRSDAVRERTAVAVTYGEIVRNAAQLSQYVDRICAQLNLSPAVVRNQIVRSKDDEAGLIARLIDVLTRLFHPLYKEDTSRGAVLYLHHRVKDRTIRFGTDDGMGALSALANVVGDVHTFFAEQVGIPAWMLPQQGLGTMQPVRELQRIFADYLKIAIQSIFQDIPTREECTQYGQGVHVIEDLNVPFGVVIIVVNGPSVYEGTYATDGSLTLTWRKLDGPSRGRALFLTEATPLFSELRSVADLEEANHYTIDDVRYYINKLIQFYRTGWRTLNTDIDAIFLAYYQAAFSAPHLSPSKVHLELVGQHSSGKSTALSTFCGGQFPHLQICPWAKGLVNYSPASIYQGFNRAAVTLGLEEFTRDLTFTTLKTVQVQSINELLRQVIFPGGAVISRALPTGGMRQMVVRTNVVTASIHPAHDPQDASRRLTIETVKIEGLKDPQIVFSELFPPEELTRMRRVLGLGLIKFYRPYREHYEKIERELGTGKLITSFTVDTRFLRNFYPIAPLMALLGEDWRSFVIKATESRRGRLLANARSDVPTQLFDTIFRTNNLRIGQSSTVTSVAVMLGSKDPARWLALNHAQAGVYYFEDLGYLVVDWISIVAPGGLLHRVEPYYRTPPNLLKHQLDQHPLSKREHQYDTAKVLSALRSFGGVMRTDEITVIDVSKVVSDLRKSFVERQPNVDRNQVNGSIDDGPPGLVRRNHILNNNL
jgi:hypothetical protein